MEKSKKVCRVLVVDDDEDMRIILGELFRMMGHEVRAAGSGDEAIRLAGEFRPDLVMLDLWMPGMDGESVALCLRKLYGKSMVIVSVSGLQTAGAYPFDAAFLKPVDTPHLADALALVP